MREIEATAKLVGLELATPEIRQVEDLAGAFEMLKSGANAVYVCADPLVNNNRARIVSWALGARLPTIYGEREHVEVGGLLSYGPNLTDLFRRAADLVDKILRGTKPSEIPVELLEEALMSFLRLVTHADPAVGGFAPRAR
jgi:putative ABC transport system substrate-binding protein